MSLDSSPFDLGRQDGSAVLCLHGLTGTPYEVRPPAEALAQAGLRAVGPMLPGHGSTPLDLARTRRDQWLDSALAAYDELAKLHERVYVLGLSMGGVVALAIGARRPVAGLVVLAAPLDLGRTVRATVPWLSRVVRFVRKTPAIRDPNARAEHPGYERMPLSAVAELIRLGREVESELESVTAPLQLIYSRRDPTVGPFNAERIQARVRSRNPNVIWLTESLHVLPVDVERDHVSAQVLEFIRGEESSRAGSNPLTPA